MSYYEIARLRSDLDDLRRDVDDALGTKVTLKGGPADNTTQWLKSPSHAIYVAGWDQYVGALEHKYERLSEKKYVYSSTRVVAPRFSS